MNLLCVASLPALGPKWHKVGPKWHKVGCKVRRQCSAAPQGATRPLSPPPLGALQQRISLSPHIGMHVPPPLWMCVPITQNHKCGQSGTFPLSHLCGPPQMPGPRASTAGGHTWQSECVQKAWMGGGGWPLGLCPLAVLTFGAPMCIVFQLLASLASTTCGRCATKHTVQCQVCLQALPMVLAMCLL